MDRRLMVLNLRLLAAFLMIAILMMMMAFIWAAVYLG